MAKLTLTFKGKMLHSQNLVDGVFTIGREQGNNLQIDSLAVAPRHASVTISGAEKLVKQLDPGYPLIINGNRVDVHRLMHGDRIGVGKHQIYFSDNDKTMPGVMSPIPDGNQEPRETSPLPKSGPVNVEASLQVLKGKNIGVVIPLRRAMTRLGTENSGSAVIAHRKEGYFLSALVADNDVKVNDIDIQEESVPLSHGDVLKVGGNTLQFFCKSAEEAEG